MPEELVINAGVVYTPLEAVREASLTIRDGVIVGLKKGWSSLPGAVDLKDFIVAPGFIDTHIHGCCGHDTNTSTATGIRSMAEELARYGVTAFLPTTVTASHEALLKAAKTVSAYVEEAGGEPLGAEPLGIHFEGPYINPEMRGAQNPEYIRPPSIEEFDEYLEASRSMLRIMDLAPEVKGSLELIGHAASSGVEVGLGHTNATYEEALRAIRAGASRATHIFNAMRRFHHRDPGVALACLQSPHVYVEVIADLVHLSPHTLRLVVDYAGPSRTVLVTDAISAAGLPDGEYTLGGLRVEVKGGVARLSSGVLAGSTLTMDRAVRNIVSLGYKLEDAFRMASLTPAQSLGLRGMGCLRPGCRADMVVLDKDLRIRGTFVKGELIYKEF